MIIYDNLIIQSDNMITVHSNVDISSLPTQVCHTDKLLKSSSELNSLALGPLWQCLDDPCPMISFKRTNQQDTHTKLPGKRHEIGKKPCKAPTVLTHMKSYELISLQFIRIARYIYIYMYTSCTHIYIYIQYAEIVYMCVCAYITDINIVCIYIMYKCKPSIYNICI